MTDTANGDSETSVPTIGAIEADIAFFDARRALLQHQPDTAYKRAQLKICDIMQQTLQAELQQLSHQQKKTLQK